MLATARRGGRALAGALGIAESTLRGWLRRAADCAAGTEPARPGRRPYVPDALERNDILTAIHAANGKIPIGALQEAYPGVPRAALKDLRRRYRKVTNKRRRRGFARLRWELAGAVWAMDHTDFAQGVEDAGRSVLVVRDLASGETLWARPCGLDAASVCAVLSRLFAEHGAPIAIKCDNGSAFTAEPTRMLLAMHGVLVLFSPPGTPSYNGSCEAGVGSIKHRAEDLAAARGDPAVNRNDLHLAQQQANACLAPRPAPCRPGTWPGRPRFWCRGRRGRRGRKAGRGRRRG